MKLNFIDLQRQYQLYKTEIDNSINKVLTSSRYVFGSEIDELEVKLAEFSGCKYAAACGSGTDALMLAILSKGLKTDDEIITTPFTFIATAEIPYLLGIKPVFVDIDEKTYNIDTTKIEAAITKNTKAILPVSIFGQIADMDEIGAIAKKYNLFVLEDAAQSFGAEYKNKKSCSFDDCGVTSFFPAKPLGCYGEGGMIFSNNKEFADKVKSIRNHGQSGKYEHNFIGFNGRIDSIQAAILLAKFKYYSDEIEKRQEKATYYNDNLKNYVTTPFIKEHNKSVYAQYSIRINNRDKVMQLLNENGIPTAVHYPKPLHLQPCFTALGYKNGDFPIAEKVSSEIMSLPFHAHITKEEQNSVIKSLKDAIK